ncbi:Holliday junction resolvase RusA-like endonuclease [Sporomusaceae bacterium BoRhaA]|uniref:RusA family crossover junction endodeoxyribonuclease n=1 Tax=Pelorhabdus rhamnosifermentans TaxID=2772457 RepID=UPI001FEAC9BA|nr:RusA family crossover junction endodeoxyribonuclease [Pelorhabdus rhamnosifermentans]MBU2703664.1 Holliday junction resolvase RusA-like endonuclease [Pelorhabdus rhamnosifermentans]
MSKLIIPGRPATKKNSSRIVRMGKRRAILPSEAFERYQDEALLHLKKYKQNYDGPVHVCCRYWLPDKRWWPDLVGLLQATSDILEKAGILENDRLIEDYDGSRIVGLDKQNPRAEIEILRVV